jgi:hypothetical protein
VARCPRRASGRPDPHHRDPLERLHRGKLDLHRCPHQATPVRRASIRAGGSGPTHSWTSIVDVTTTLVTVATDDRAWGQAWLTLTNPPLTVREIATRFTAVVGAPKPKLTALPYPVLWTAGLFSPLIRELRTTRYQFVRPFVLDSSLTERTFALTPIDLNTALASLRPEDCG